MDRLPFSFISFLLTNHWTLKEIGLYPLNLLLTHVVFFRKAAFVLFDFLTDTNACPFSLACSGLNPDSHVIGGAAKFVLCRVDREKPIERQKNRIVLCFHLGLSVRQFFE